MLLGPFPLRGESQPWLQRSWPTHREAKAAGEAWDNLVSLDPVTAGGIPHFIPHHEPAPFFRCKFTSGFWVFVGPSWGSPVQDW